MTDEDWWRYIRRRYIRRTVAPQGPMHSEEKALAILAEIDAENLMAYQVGLLGEDGPHSDRGMTEFPVHCKLKKFDLGELVDPDEIAPEGDDSVMHPNEAAHILGLNPSTLNKMRHQGRGPAFIETTTGGTRRGARIMYIAADVWRFSEELKSTKEQS